MDAGFFRGTSLDQDVRFVDKEKKLIESMQFPPEFNKKVDIKKVRLDVIKPWIAQKVTELLGTEDDILIGMIFGYLENNDVEEINPKKIQVNLTPFLEKKTANFVKELWDLLLSAQENIGGIPTVILEQKRQELLRLKEQNERAQQHIEAAQAARHHNGAHPPSSAGSQPEPSYGLNTRPGRSAPPPRDARDERRSNRGRSRSRSRSRSRDRRHPAGRHGSYYHSSRRSHSRRSPSRSRSRSTSRSRHHRSHRHRSHRHSSRSPSGSRSRSPPRSRSRSRSRSPHRHHRHHRSSHSSHRSSHSRHDGRHSSSRRNGKESDNAPLTKEEQPPSSGAHQANGNDEEEKTEESKAALEELRQQVVDSIAKKEEENHD